MSPTSAIAYEDLKKVNHVFEKDFTEKLNSFLDKGWYILGKEVTEFENNFAAYCGSAHCIGVANGLDALELGLEVLDLPKGSEIIVASNTYIASILSIINAGHTPVLVEPDINTYLIDANLIEQSITSNTRAIMVVHLYGKVANMKQIVEIAKRHSLEIIEDCAQSHGAWYNNKMTGTFGKIGAYSFYPTKNLGALGDAGAIITSDDNIAQKLRALRNYGSDKKYYNTYEGRNSRLDELQAAFLNVKLPYLEKITAHKKTLANLYNQYLSKELILPLSDNDGNHVYHIYNIRTSQRDALRTYLSSHGISTEIHYPLAPHLQLGYKHHFTGLTFPISELIHDTTLSLPISFAHTKEEIMYVIEKINLFFAKT